MTLLTTVAGDNYGVTNSGDMMATMAGDDDGGGGNDVATNSGK